MLEYESRRYTATITAAMLSDVAMTHEVLFFVVNTLLLAWNGSQGRGPYRVNACDGHPALSPTPRQLLVRALCQASGNYQNAGFFGGINDEPDVSRT